MHSTVFDPSLLPALHALLQERHVSRAAKRVGVTQSAMSRTLSRIRECFGDPILVRSGRSMTLTPRGQSLVPMVAALTRDLEQLAVLGESFDPATSKRTFRIATADYGVSVVVTPLVARLATVAPRLEIVVLPLYDDLQRDLHAGWLDLVLTPIRPAGANLVWTRLLSDRFVTIVRKDHPAAARALDLDKFCALSHVVVTPEGSRPGTVSAVDRWLARRAQVRHVALRVPSFIAALGAVAGSDLVLTTFERLVDVWGTHLGLHRMQPPVPIDRLSFSMAWHERQRADAGHAWLRRLIQTTCSAPLGADSSGFVELIARPDQAGSGARGQRRAREG